MDKNWKIKVADQGDSISDENKIHIFERFKRADKKGIKGSGLGLAIVKRVVDIHNGSVGVEDNPNGKGSVFWVMLKKA
jgi:signal transduction histidine kinase